MIEIFIHALKLHVLRLSLEYQTILGLKHITSSYMYLSVLGYHSSTKPYWGFHNHISLKLHMFECLLLSLNHQTVSGYMKSNKPSRHLLIHQSYPTHNVGGILP